MTSAIQRVALYARVSASNGHQHPEMQLRELRDFVERRGWQISSEYVDDGISGSKDSRPALNQLMADAGRRKFDAVIVWRFDGFARSVSHLLRALEVFQALGVDFISLSENVDTSTPTGKMVFTVRRRGRTGTQPDRRAGESRAAQCESQGQTAGPPAHRD
jgi:DNA invertase Pin-like site-specific DNA recombinase